VTAADVKFTFEEVLLKYHGRTRAALGKNLQAVESPDAHTVVFHFKEPYAPFLALVDAVNAPMLPQLPPPHELARLRQLLGVVVTTRGREGFAGIVTLVPNLRLPVLSDPKVRQAMAYAIDRGVILDRVYFGNGEVATGLISRALGWAYNPEVPRYDRDLGRANKLLDEAGHPRSPSGIRFPLSILYDASFAKLAEVLRDQLSEVGIDLQLRLMERNAWIDAVYKRWDFDLAFTHFENGADPDIGVKRVYVSSNIVPVPFSNAAGYQNPHVDQLFDRGARELDRVARTQAYFEIQDILVRDSPYLWLVEAGRLWGVAFRSEFRGLHSWSSKSIMTYGDDAWWSKGKLGRE
jgi:peptide/nickel transport system substrate-binding protein